MTCWRRLVAFVSVVAFLTATVSGQSSAFASPTSYAYDAAVQHPSRRPADDGVSRTAIRASLQTEDTHSDIPAHPARDFVAADTGSGASSVARDAAESCLNSFTSDTPIALADGTTKPIQDVKVGDRVLATDPETGETKAEPVEQLIRHSGRHAMVLISLANGSMLDSTEGHPVWDATLHAFVDAGKLHVGDRIETTGARLIRVTALTTYSADLTAYNLQIRHIHTYFAGATPVLVHNSCAPLTTSQATQMAERVGYRATNQVLRNQRVFTNGKNYIVQDIDSHAGGLWKMAETIRGLGGKTTRTGTYDYNLERVGP